MGIHYKFPDTGIQKVDDVGRQLEKIIKCCNQGSYQTRYRHAAAMSRFIKWVVPEYKLKKLANVQDKHIIRYGKHLLMLGKSQKYIKDELSGVRFIHRHTPNCRYELDDSELINKRIGLGSTPNGLADRKWTIDEFIAMVDQAHKTNNIRIALMMECALRFGTRLDEAVSLRRNSIEAALRNNVLKLTNTKGGRIRYVPTKERDRAFLELCIKGLPRGKYVFCPEGYTLHSYKKYVQKFIRRNRIHFQDPDRKTTAHGVADHERGPLTFHGLRHSFSANEYQTLLKELKQDREARKELAERLGHGRITITKTYLGF